MKSFDGREKSLLRAAMNAEAYNRTLRERLAELVRAGSGPLDPFLSPELGARVRREGAAALEQGMSRAALETTLQLDAWLRTYDVDVVL
ncbi:hypothetical protein [Streptomyces dangxiongensis]|uniref:hypothetical protein n=1 Tax=Streptomyces dangxiongensis TaxID=1442032 RepID=UPI001F08CD88|nr:hypothetical protein [Streptomyces dangxiongensis]